MSRGAAVAQLLVTFHGHSHRSAPVRVERLAPNRDQKVRRGATEANRGGRYGCQVPVVEAAVVPTPPVLVPEVGGLAAADLADLLEACDAAVAALYASRPERLVLLGWYRETLRFPFDAHATFASYGVPLRCGGSGAALPLSLSIGRWLVERQDPAVRGNTRVDYQSVATDSTAQQCRDLGRRIASQPRTTALLCLADGTTCRCDDAPGGFDPAAERFDGLVAGALAEGAPDGLAALPEQDASALGATGLAPLRVLAAAVPPVRLARLRYAAAPFGVGYTVASWSCL